MTEFSVGDIVRYTRDHDYYGIAPGTVLVVRKIVPGYAGTTGYLWGDIIDSPVPEILADPHNWYIYDTDAEVVA